MDDLSKRLNSMNIGCMLGNVKINNLMYADDLVLLAPSLNGLKKLVKECQIYGDIYDIKYNSAKSNVMVFQSAKRKDIPTEISNIELKGEKITLCDQYKYLGHIICNNLKDDKDIARQCRKLYAQGNMLVRKFYMCSENVKVKLFKAYCTPLYTCQLWWNCPSSSAHKLCVAL